MAMSKLAHKINAITRVCACVEICLKFRKFYLLFDCDMTTGLPLAKELGCVQVPQGPAALACLRLCDTSTHKHLCNSNRTLVQ